LIGEDLDKALDGSLIQAHEAPWVIQFGSPPIDGPFNRLIFPQCGGKSILSTFFSSHSIFN